MHMRTRVFPTQASLASQALQEPIYSQLGECGVHYVQHSLALEGSGHIARQHSSKEPQGTLCAKNGSTKKDHSEHATQV